MPTIYKWVQPDGEILSVEALRLVFGSSFSPVVSHAAACWLLGIEDSVYTKDKNTWLSNLVLSRGCTDHVSGIYVDDFVEAATSKVVGESAYRRKRSVFEAHGCGIKESSVVEGAHSLDFAGKSYCGIPRCMKIGNTRKNKVKAIALLLCFIDGVCSREIVASLVGTIGYLGNQHAFCFPFLDRANRFALGSSDPCDGVLLSDLVIALAIASTPWSPDCDVRWEYPDLPRERWIFVDAQNDYARFGIIWCHNGIWIEASVFIPSMFSGTQQCAELYAL